MKKQHIPAYPARVRKKWSFLLYKAGWSASRICREYGISRKTLYKWIRKDRTLPTHRPKKQQPALKLTSDIKVFIERQKRYTNAGPLKLSLVIKRRFDVDVSSTIVYRYLKKKNLITRPQKKLPWYTPLKRPIPATAPGTVVELDIKYVWKNAGRWYQRTFLDVCTRMQYVHISNKKDDETTLHAFDEACVYFPFTILGIQTDNGGEFRGDFHKHLTKIGVAHYFIPKGSPQWNGCVERAHRSIDEEYYRNPTSPLQNTDEYIHWYNHERLHLGRGMNGLTPMEKYLQYQYLSP